MSTAPTPHPLESTIPREINATPPGSGGSNGSARLTLIRTGIVPKIRPQVIRAKLV